MGGGQLINDGAAPPDAFETPNLITAADIINRFTQFSE